MPRDGRVDAESDTGAEPPLADLRRNRIAAAVNRTGSMSSADLVAEFGVSPMTIRRDINQLAHEGAVVRVHGGAVAAPVPGSARRATDWSIGMVAPSLGHYWSQIAYSAQAEAGRRGARFVLRPTVDYYRDSLPFARRLVADNRLDGLLLSPPSVPEFRPAVEEWVLHHSPRTVFVERDVVDLRLSHVQTVRSDHSRGTAMAIQHLVDLGHRRIALMLPAVSPSRLDILAAWQRTIELLELPSFPVFESALLTKENSPQQMRTTLTEFRDLGITGTLVVGDMHALTVLQVARELGMTVPNALSVIGFDDDVAVMGEPPLTSVRPPRETVGRLAVQLLLDHLRYGDDHPIQHIRVNPTLSIRESTGPAPR